MSIRTLRRLTDILGLLSKGRFSEKCDEHFEEAMKTLEALPNEKGTATITLTLTLLYESGRIDIKPAIKSKLPEEKAFSSTPFWAHEGGVSTQHPSQADMFGPREASERIRETA